MSLDITQGDLIDAIGQAQSKRDVTKLPEFFGDKGKDTLSASSFVKRVEAAARAGKWNDEQTISFFKLALSGRAETWFEIKADRSDPDWETDFNQVASDFIMRFEPSAVGTRTLASVKDLYQKSDESVQDFADRLMKISLQWRRATPLPANAVSLEQKAFTRLGMRLHGEYILLTHLTIGLKDGIKAAVFKRCPASFDEALNIALDYEAGLENLKRNGGEEKNAKISAMNGRNFSRDRNQIQTEPLTEKEKKMTCYYCKKVGHPQRKCYTRIRKGDPMKPFPKRSGKAAAIGEEDYNDEDDQDEEISDVGELAAISQGSTPLNFLGVV